MRKLKSLSFVSQKYHPDVNKEADAEAKFKEINEAYEVLSDENKKLNMISLVMQPLMVVQVAKVVLEALEDSVADSLEGSLVALMI